MDAFLLPDTHDRIRCFREALRSGPGLLVHRARAKELDFWDWELSRVKDLTLHLAYRETIGLAERSRWFTGWDTRGRKQIAPGLWPELVDCWNMRRLDMVDCFAGAASKFVVLPLSVAHLVFSRYQFATRFLVILYTIHLRGIYPKMCQEPSTGLAFQAFRAVVRPAENLFCLTKDEQ